MPEYIEREALKKRLACSPLFMLTRDVMFPMKEAVLDLVDKQPAADVAEVRHGEWKDNGMIKTGGLTECHPAVRCSECEIVFCDLINNHRVMFHYCPYCGAKMDGKGEGK